MKKLCYFKWYPADAMGDSDWAAMNHAERGFYMQCLNFAWLNSGIPSDPGERAKLLSTRQTLADKLWVRVSKKFVASPSVPGLLVNSRQEIDRQEVIEKSQQCAEAGSKTKRKREQTLSYGSRSGAKMETSTEVQNAQVPIESENVENGRSRFVKPRALARADSDSDSDADSEDFVLNSKPEEKTVTRAQAAGKPQHNPATTQTQANGDGRKAAAQPDSAVRAITLVPQQPQDLFQVFWNLFVAAGKHLNDTEKYSCLTIWSLYSEPEHRQIITWVISQMKTVWRNEQYTKMPSNALRSQGWVSVAQPRRIPDVQQARAATANGPEVIAKMLRNYRGTS